MDPQISASRRGLCVAFVACAIGSLPTHRAIAQPEFVVKPIAEKKLKELPAGPLFWRVENFPTIEQARAAENPASLAVEVAGKAWLLTLGPKRSAVTGGSDAVEIGPVPTFSATEYLLRINYAKGPPGARTPVHTHPGSETFYVLTGELGQKTPHGVAHVGAGRSMAGHAPGTPMEVFSSGHSTLTAIVMFLVDASKPFSSPAKFE